MFSPSKSVALTEQEIKNSKDIQHNQESKPSSTEKSFTSWATLWTTIQKGKALPTLQAKKIMDEDVVYDAPMPFTLAKVK